MRFHPYTIITGAIPLVLIFFFVTIPDMMVSINGYNSVVAAMRESGRVPINEPIWSVVSTQVMRFGTNVVWMLIAFGIAALLLHYWKNFPFDQQKKPIHLGILIVIIYIGIVFLTTPVIINN